MNTESDLMMDMPMTSPELDAAEARFLKLQQRTAKNFNGYGATTEALAIASSCIDRLAVAISERLEQPIVASKGWDEASHRLLSCIEPHTIALTAIDRVLTAARDDRPLVFAYQGIGKMLNHELFASELRLHDEALKDKIEKWVSEKHGSLKFRLQAARSVAKKMGFSFVNNWTPKQCVGIGSFVCNILLDALPDLVTVEGEGEHRHFEVTDKTCEIAAGAMRQFVRMNPIFLPSVQPPVPWTAFNKGGPVDPVAQKLGTLVRTRHRETVAAVKAAIKSGQMQPAMDALNAVQATGWKINHYIFSVIKECARRGIGVAGIPPRGDFPMPELDRAWEELSDDEKKLHRIRKQGIKKANRALVSDRLTFDEVLETAEALSEHPQFYIPHNLDWRGREYPMTNFNFQRGDLTRALFLFKDGEPIGEEGIAWLKVHLANCGDFEKVSKKSYEDRIKWVDDNLDRIRGCAMQDWECTGPFDAQALQFWTQADKPFLFLAACAELTKALSFGPDYVCSLPCSWDGSCSGLQHLCLMTHAEEGAFVNLTDQEQPQDVYQMVADRAYAAIEAVKDDTTPSSFAKPKKDAEPRRIPTVGELAQRVLVFDGNRRSIVKRNTMTYSYSSGRFGMAEQHMTDLMEPLSLEVLQGKYARHPFGSSWVEQSDAARFLAGKVHRAIEEIVNRPAKAMEFLQDLARALAHEGKPLEWVTPIGLPWSNRYHDVRVDRVSLWLHDSSIRINVANGYQKDIDKKRAVNGVAPNFVHACDGSHLLLTVLAAAREGITQFALVHDSFGCLPSRAARFQGIIRETLVEMYEQHDVLAEVLQQAKSDLNDHNRRLSEIEAKLVDLRGNLNIKEVLNAKYAFA